MTRYEEFSYLSEVRVRISVGPLEIEGPPDEFFEYRVFEPAIPRGQSWSDKEYLDIVEEATQGAGSEYRVPYILDVKKGHYSWGADNAAAEIALHLSRIGIEGVVGWLAIETVKTIFQKLSQFSTWEGEPLEREEAVARAHWIVAERYNLGEDPELELVKESYGSSKGRWDLTFKASDGTKYSVVLGLVDGLPNTTHISRRQSGED